MHGVFLLRLQQIEHSGSRTSSAGEWLLYIPCSAPQHEARVGIGIFILFTSIIVITSSQSSTVLHLKVEMVGDMQSLTQETSHERQVSVESSMQMMHVSEL